MPWTGGQLRVAPWHFGPTLGLYAKVGKPRVVAGNPGSEGISQPTWGYNDGSLSYCSDRTGFWQLYCLELVEVDFTGPEY